MAHLREQGRANLDALTAIRRRLLEEDIERPLVRVLDAIVWFSHLRPGSRAPRARSSYASSD